MEAKDINSAVKQMSVLMAKLYYYLTKGFVEEYGDSAKDIIAKSMLEFGRARGAAIAKEVIEAGEELTIANLDKFYDMPITSGWNLERTYYDDHKDSVTESCTFASTMIENDWIEIGHLYCLVDTGIREGYSSNIQFIPINNILEGDEHCKSLSIYKDRYKGSIPSKRDKQE